MSSSKVTLRLLVLLLGGLGLTGCFPGMVTTPVRPMVTANDGTPLSVQTTPWLGGPDHLIGFGDSMTEGFGATKGRGYFQRLADPTEAVSLATLWPAVKAENYAVSCSTSLDHIDSQLKRIPHHASGEHGWVLVTSGGNDIIHNYGLSPPEEGAMYGATEAEAAVWIENYEVRLETMLRALKDRFPGGCDIFLANIYDPTDGVGDIENTNIGLPAWPEGLAIHGAYNDVIARTAAKFPWVHLVDIHSEFLGHGIHREGGDLYWYYYNLEDPNDHGYEALRALFLKEMEKVAQQRGWTKPPARSI